MLRGNAGEDEVGAGGVPLAGYGAVFEGAPGLELRVEVLDYVRLLLFVDVCDIVVTEKDFLVLDEICNVELADLSFGWYIGGKCYSSSKIDQYRRLWAHQLVVPSSS